MWRRGQQVELRSPLTAAIPVAEVCETHHRLVAADVDTVWAALSGITFGDLPGAGILMRVRHGTHAPEHGRPLLTNGPVPCSMRDAPTYAAGLKAARPWQRQPATDRALPLDTAADFDEPGWLIMGTDFRLVSVGERSCLLITQTRCHPTSTDAARKFGRYWAGIAPFSKLIRRELLRAVARSAEASSAAV